jgi:hypothetical protein
MTGQGRIYIAIGVVLLLLLGDLIQSRIDDARRRAADRAVQRPRQRAPQPVLHVAVAGRSVLHPSLLETRLQESSSSSPASSSLPPRQESPSLLLLLLASL